MNNKGFTLVEIIISIVIIGTVATIIFVSLDPMALFKKSRNASRDTHIENIRMALTRYESHNMGMVPDCIERFPRFSEASGCDELVPGHLSEIPQDPREEEYKAGWASSSHRDFFVYSSAPEWLEEQGYDSEVEFLSGELGIVVVADNDGQIYTTVEIENNLWMAENLNYSTENSSCYEEEEENCDMYGRLYTESSVQCPSGWKLPTEAKFDSLGTNVGQLKDDQDWDGSNEKGFSALPAGKYNGSDYVDLGSSAYFWLDNGGYRVLSSSIGSGTAGPDERLSVRCIEE